MALKIRLNDGTYIEKKIDSGFLMLLEDKARTKKAFEIYIEDVVEVYVKEELEKYPEYKVLRRDTFLSEIGVDLEISKETFFLKLDLKSQKEIIKKSFFDNKNFFIDWLLSRNTNQQKWHIDLIIKYLQNY